MNLNKKNNVQLLSKFVICQIVGEDFDNFWGLLRKHELQCAFQKIYEPIVKKLVCQFSEQIPRWVGVMPRGQLWNVPSRPIALVRAVSSNHCTVGWNHFWSTLIVSLQTVPILSWSKGCTHISSPLALMICIFNDSKMERQFLYLPGYIFTLQSTGKEMQGLLGVLGSLTR